MDTNRDAVRVGRVVVGNDHDGCGCPGGAILDVPTDAPAFHEAQDAGWRFEAVQNFVYQSVERVGGTAGASLRQIFYGALHLGRYSFTHIIGNLLAPREGSTAGGEDTQQPDEYDAGL